MRVLARRLVLAALACLALLLVLGVALGFALHAAQRDPQALTQRLEALFPRDSGFSLSLGTVGVRLFPLPRLVAGDIQVRGPNFRASVAYAVATPSLIALLRGDALPVSLRLYRPQVTASLPLESFVSAGKGAAGDARELSLPSCRVQVQQGQAVLYARDGSALSLVNARCNLRVRERSLRGSAGWSSLTVYDAAASPLAGLVNADLEGDIPLVDTLRQDMRLKLETLAAFPLLLPVLRIAVSLDGRLDDGQADINLDGRLRVASALVPFGLGGRLERGEGAEGASLKLERWRLELAEDSARLDGEVRFGKAGFADPMLRGRLAVHRLSLTRWLDFARDLPPGLQWALDNITRGEADFELDGAGLRVPRITAASTGSVFQGCGGVASWSDPVIALELNAPFVNLGLALPEAVGRAPEAPYYVHPPLTSAYDDPDAPPSSWSPGFDIRLGARELRHGPLRLENAEIRITPGREKKGATNGALLTARADMYGGRLQSETLVAGAGGEVSYAIKGSARDVRAADLARDMAFFPFASGVCEARVDVESRGSGLDAFLRRLRGSVHATVARGRFRSGMDGGVRDFERVTLEVAPRGGRVVQERGADAARIDALWKANIEAPGLETDAQMDGPLIFGGRSRLRSEGVALRGNLHMSPQTSSLPRGLTAGVAGQCSFNAAESSFSLRRAAMSTLGVEGQGDLRFSSGRNGPSWQAKLRLHCSDLDATLRQALGKDSSLPPALRRWELSGEFRGQAGSFSATSMRAGTSLFSLEGDVSAQWSGARPLVRFDLVAPDLDYDALMAAAFPGSGEDAASGQPWDLRVMKSFDAEGVVHVQRLTAWKLRLSSLSFPLTLNDGLLRCKEARANCYGAPLHASLDARFDKGVDLALDVKADGIDVEGASRDRADPKAFGGRGAVELELRQRMTAGGQWASSLNGLWKISLVNGYMQDRGRDGRLRGRPTPVMRCSASGNIRSGVVRSSDFFYLGDDMQAQGGGWLHLVRKQLDCNLAVKLGRIPPFPVRVYGPLDNPRTSIGAGTALLRLLGNIAGSVGDVIGGLFSGFGQFVK